MEVSNSIKKVNLSTIKILITKIKSQGDETTGFFFFNVCFYLTDIELNAKINLPYTFDKKILPHVIYKTNLSCDIILQFVKDNFAIRNIFRTQPKHPRASAFAKIVFGTSIRVFFIQIALFK